MSIANRSSQGGRWVCGLRGVRCTALKHANVRIHPCRPRERILRDDSGVTPEFHLLCLGVEYTGEERVLHITRGTLNDNAVPGHKTTDVRHTAYKPPRACTLVG